MDYFFVAIAIAVILVGLAGLYRAARQLPALGSPVTRFFFSVRGREPGRRHFALISSATIVFGAFILWTSMVLAVPVWPSLVLLAALLVLQLSAHLTQGDA